MLVLPLDAACSGLVDAVLKNVPTAVGVRLDQDFDETTAAWPHVVRVYRGWITHPNVFATVLMGSSESDPLISAVTAGLPASVRYRIVTLIESGGWQEATATAVQAVREWIKTSAGLKREPAPWSQLVLGTECGGSDGFSGITANPTVGWVTDRLVSLGGTTILAETPELIGAEHLLAGRTDDEAVRRRLLEVVKRAEQSAQQMGVDFQGTQPAPGNIAGGITTIEEKSLGCVHKGGTHPVREVVEYAQAPLTHGLVVMDTPGHDVMQLVGMAAGGAQLVVFTTGRGTPTGSAILPVVKVSTTTRLADRMPLLIDFDAGAVLGGESLASVGERLWQFLAAVASGDMVAAERAGHREFGVFLGWGGDSHPAAAANPTGLERSHRPSNDPGAPTGPPDAVLQIHPADTVAVALKLLAPGTVLTRGGTPFRVRSAVPPGHKVAVAPTRPGAAVIKYGHVIGYAITDIVPGDHVHSHNVESGRARGDRVGEGRHH